MPQLTQIDDYYLSEGDNSGAEWSGEDDDKNKPIEGTRQMPLVKDEASDDNLSLADIAAEPEESALMRGLRQDNEDLKASLIT
jgi:hypothetical protein